MESQRIFRTAIGGFKKEDVLAYIANLSEMIDTLKAEQQREIDSYHASIEELKQQLEDSGSKAASAAAKSEENARRAADAEAKTPRSRRNILQCAPMQSSAARPLQRCRSALRAWSRRMPHCVRRRRNMTV